MGAMEDPVVTTCISLAAAFAIYKLVFWRTSALSSVPTLGRSNPILSYKDARRFVSNSKDLLEEGYAKYKGGFFKIAMPEKWMVIATGAMAEEVIRLPDDTASFMESVKQTTQLKYTAGRDIAENMYHIDLVQTKLTKNLAVLFPGVLEEIELGFAELIPDNDWSVLCGQDVLRTVVCRASNKIFVGAPLCRDPDFQMINMRFAASNSRVIDKLRVVPEFLQPLIASWYSEVGQMSKECLALLGPTIEERLRLVAEYGLDYPDKPNDMLSWLIDAAPEGPHREPEALCRRILSFNFAAIHTSTATTTHVFYDLAREPEEYLPPLREEIERVVREDGWTKVAMTKLHKVDSFIKESTRFNTFVGLTISRKMLKGHTFSNGTYLPKGTFLSTPTSATHFDETNYKDPYTFNPWRFSDMRDERGEGTKHQFVSTSPEFLPFGHGRHACPGRFFAANEIKLILAWLVVNYDFQLENGSRVRPANVPFTAALMPNPVAKVCFRKRQESGL